LFIQFGSYGSVVNCLMDEIVHIVTRDGYDTYRFPVLCRSRLPEIRQGFVIQQNVVSFSWVVVECCVRTLTKKSVLTLLCSTNCDDIRSTYGLIGHFIRIIIRTGIKDNTSNNIWSVIKRFLIILNALKETISYLIYILTRITKFQVYLFCRVVHFKLQVMMYV
jgi:hypothetical protein